MDRPLAEQVLDFLTLATGALNGAYRSLHQAQDADYTEQKKRIGMLIALVGTGLMRQIYKEHPDLCPTGFRETLDFEIAPELEWPFP